MDAKKWFLLLLVVLGGSSSTDVRCMRNGVNTLGVPDGESHRGVKKG